jgi:phosphosulfolactate synthase
MNDTTLQLPERSVKPRSSGITMVIDGGLPTRMFADHVESGAEFLDFVKFGWGTVIVTDRIAHKIEFSSRLELTTTSAALFEKYVLQDRFDDFRELCHR